MYGDSYQSACGTPIPLKRCFTCIFAVLSNFVIFTFLRSERIENFSPSRVLRDVSNNLLVTFSKVWCHQPVELVCLSWPTSEHTQRTASKNRPDVSKSQITTFPISLWKRSIRLRHTFLYTLSISTKKPLWRACGIGKTLCLILRTNNTSLSATIFLAPSFKLIIHTLLVPYVGDTLLKPSCTPFLHSMYLKTLCWISCHMSWAERTLFHTVDFEQLFAFSTTRELLHNMSTSQWLLTIVTFFFEEEVLAKGLISPYLEHPCLSGISCLYLFFLYF